MHKLIRVIATPPGAIAPEKIREQWIGITLPVVTTENEIRSGWNGNDNADGYIVNTTEAIQALRRAEKTEAANYWEEIQHQTGDQLRFGRAYCAVI